MCSLFSSSLFCKQSWCVWPITCHLHQPNQFLHCWINLLFVDLIYPLPTHELCFWSLSSYIHTLFPHPSFLIFLTFRLCHIYHLLVTASMFERRTYGVAPCAINSKWCSTPHLVNPVFPWVQHELSRVPHMTASSLKGILLIISSA